VETHSVKLPIIAGDYFTIYIEHVGKHTFIHMTVSKWSKTIRKQFLDTWLAWAEKQAIPLYAMPFIDDEKMAKWVKLCGFDLLNNHVCADGVTRKLYVWRNNHG